MKKILFALLVSCMLCFNVYAQGVRPPASPLSQPSPVLTVPVPEADDADTDTAENLQDDEAEEDADDDQPDDAQDDQAGDTADQSPPQLPRDIRSGTVTPEQIKSFFSKPREENYIILNFDNADLKDVINTVGSITNENFIMSPGLDARITIHSAKKIPVSEVMNVFESVLEVNGISLVRSGEFLKVVSGTAAKQKPIDVFVGKDFARLKVLL